MFEKMAELGLFRQLPFHSHTSQYGQLSRHETLDKAFIRTTLEKAYAHIEGGGFAEEWKSEQARGMPEYNRLLNAALNSEMSRLEAPLLAGASTGGEPAPVEIAIEAPVVTEHVLRAALAGTQRPEKIRLGARAVLTPGARDAARERGIEIVRQPAK
jgi:hypothetical protein